MPRTPEQNRIYMRGYRAKKVREAASNPVAVVGSFTGQVATLKARIEELEEEVRHLKEELARRPIPSVGPATVQPLIVDAQYGQRFNTRPFTPVPKKP